MSSEDFAYVTCIGMTNLGAAQFEFCQELGFFLCEQGYSIRSGKAPGADQAFQVGFERAMNDAEYIRDHQIFLPWRKFEYDNGFTSNAYDVWDFPPESIAMAEEICAEVHPVWGSLSRGQRLFHIRNIFQSLGLNCQTPSKFVIACAHSDKENLPKGGTRTAYKTALDRGVPCININGLSRELVYDWLRKAMDGEVR